jgi:predicted AlkP superfamily pyrophosphatase or phosphodiesterase
MTSPPVVLLSIPALRSRDLAAMPRLAGLATEGAIATLTASFPCVTWPAQANMLTGRRPNQHGIVANGFFWRDEQRVEMWTARNEKITAPQIWDTLHRMDPSIQSAVWFPMLSRNCGADFVCMPAPIHNPDGSEDLWCYTKPTELYGQLRSQFGDFPLQHFWGPLAGIASSRWIVESAVHAAECFRPSFFFVYLPHLDYAAQKLGPDSAAAHDAVIALDELIGHLIDGFASAYDGSDPVWLAASEYVITEVDHVSYPNRVLREAGLLAVREDGTGEQLDVAASRAWALVDHQFSHVFVRDDDPQVRAQVVDLFRDAAGFAEVLAGPERAKYALDHERSGEVVLISTRNSWQAYYWWFDDARAPNFARTVDIHKKPGYDPVELHFDPATKSIPLDATLVKGSHGAPVQDDDQRGIILASRPHVLNSPALADVDVADLVVRQFRGC